MKFIPINQKLGDATFRHSDVISTITREATAKRIFVHAIENPDIEVPLVPKLTKANKYYGGLRKVYVYIKISSDFKNRLLDINDLDGADFGVNQFISFALSRYNQSYAFRYFGFIRIPESNKSEFAKNLYSANKVYAAFFGASTFIDYSLSTDYYIGLPEEIEHQLDKIANI